MTTWFAVAVGGALGSVARHGVNHLVHARFPLTRFPAATVLVNLIGCFVIGLLSGLLAAGRAEFRYLSREFVFVGILGGFTTFSTFGLDTFLLARTHSAAMAFVNTAVQVVVGLWLVWAGYTLGAARS
jgi:fluoride exporter